MLGTLRQVVVLKFMVFRLNGALWWESVDVSP